MRLACRCCVGLRDDLAIQDFASSAMMERVEAPRVIEALEDALGQADFEVMHEVLGGEAALVARRAA